MYICTLPIAYRLVTAYHSSCQGKSDTPTKTMPITSAKPSPTESMVHPLAPAAKVAKARGPWKPRGTAIERCRQTQPIRGRRNHGAPGPRLGQCYQHGPLYEYTHTSMYMCIYEHICMRSSLLSTK